MSDKIHFTKSELKKADGMTENLRKGFAWSAVHFRIVFAALAIFIVGGGALTIYSTMQEKSQEKLKDAFFSAEKKCVPAN